MRASVPAATALGLCLAVLGCGREPQDDGPARGVAALVAATGLPEDLLLALAKEGAGLRRLEGLDAEGKSVAVAGVTIDVPEDRASALVRSLRGRVPPGLLPFVSERNFGIGGRADHVSVMRAADPWEVLRAMGTNGWNHDLGPDDVVRRLRAWDARHGLVLLGAGFDWCEADLLRPPEDWLALAREVHDFCPDVVDQGTGSVESLADEMRQQRTLYLWWD